MLQQYDNETCALTSAKSELERAIKLSKEAVATLHCQTDDELELEKPTPEVAAVIDARDASIPHDLKETVRSVLDSVVSPVVPCEKDGAEGVGERERGRPPCCSPAHLLIPCSSIARPEV